MNQTLSTPERPIKIPGPDHMITIETNTDRIVISAAGQTVASTNAALTLHEAGYAPVYYIPRSDVDMALLKRSEHTTYCPYKGEATYFSIPHGGERSVNAAWSYESPHKAVLPIKDHLAFYTARVDAMEERKED